MSPRCPSSGPHRKPGPCSAWKASNPGECFRHLVGMKRTIPMATVRRSAGRRPTGEIQVSCLPGGLPCFGVRTSICRLLKLAVKRKHRWGLLCSRLRSHSKSCRGWIVGAIVARSRGAYRGERRGGEGQVAAGDFQRPRRTSPARPKKIMPLSMSTIRRPVSPSSARSHDRPYAGCLAISSGKPAHGRL